MTPASVSKPPPALVVIGGGAQVAQPVAAQPAGRLLKALPQQALRILQVGEDGGTLERAHGQRHPGGRWLTCAHLPPRDEPPFDAIVIGSPLAAFEDPLALLRALAHWSHAETQLVLDTANQATLQMLARVAEGDLSDADGGPLCGPHLRYASPASLYKLLLDAGWMPALADAAVQPARHEALAAAAFTLADALNVPRATAQRLLTTERLTVHARRGFDEAPAEPGRARFAAVVPTTRENQLRLNVELSPGLREVQARIVSYRHAASPAEALQGSLQHVDAEWVLLCHQDVYFPAGFGERLNAVLAAIPEAERASTLIGFAGMGVNRQTHAYEKAGFVIDRLHRFDHPACDAAVSFDELALVIARDSIHRIDPALGWHLWATDLCLGSICEHQVFPRIVRLPLFHNSLNDYQLPGSFYASAQTLLAKYPQFGPIPTLCGTLTPQFLQQAGAR